jgi:hypothetical protein
LVESVLIEYTTAHEHNPPEAHRPIRISRRGYYESVPVSDLTATTLIQGIMNNNLPVQMRLVAYLIGEETPTILDEMSFYTPYRFMVLLYANDVGYDYAEFMVYQSGARRLDMDAWLDLYQGETLLESKLVSISQDDDSYYGVPVRFEGLSGTSEYSAVLRASYVHPDTLKETTSTTESVTFTTMPMYSVEVTSFMETETGFDVEVTVVDPFEIVTFISAYLITRDEEGLIDQYFYYDFSEETFGEEILFTTTIAKPEALHYEIEIYMYKQYLNAYYEQEIYTYVV